MSCSFDEARRCCGRVVLRQQDTHACGEASSPDVGICVALCVGMHVGRRGEQAGDTEALPGRPDMLAARQGSVDWSWVNTFGRLHQAEFHCPIDGCTPIADIELAVNAFCVGAERTQGNHKFARNLRPGKLGLEQAQYV